MIELNYLAVLVAGLVAFCIGFIWYAPAVFGKQWMTLSGMTKEKMEQAKKDGMAKQMVAGLVSMLVMAYVMSFFIIGWHDSAVALNPDITSTSIGVQTAFWMWLGVVATILLGSVLWEKKPLKLYAINTLHWLVVMLAMGAILGGWR
ncbi:MAG: hypothetical protein COU33_03475 [Candidatus Magasanikbacteria bacterium CG10_big_fil_rev_8_21_14_0_10_43_6]|uniref:DUF1761 domain-containing protein n=1 Tax=Candidatus Magasanikbacteria bacterium CG10_big_fil_rev_8_21_14_0_10_43_6 TaxID=1974650 RepID=A0A2M6W0P8_9BACT|nr:MAG: hypothetical protein COU33_03475 [Candidatus Magasanikbacteria bacterium CG10_big_fil_rev_8_21_14_0_10_43_6]